MLEKLKKQKKSVEFYDCSTLPLDKDCFLLSESNINIISKQWIEYLSTDVDQENWAHPNELMDYIHCNITSVDENNINITILIDRNSRFHTISKTLPLAFFKTAFKVFTSEKRPYIIVNQQWFQDLKTNIYSTYVMIDFVGIRNLLAKYGEFPIEKLNSIKSIIDEYSEKNADLTFLTCADNIIIKSGWELAKTNLQYNHERLIKTVNQIMSDIKKKTEISSYAIFTQGANYVNETNLDKSKTPSNHHFISSISVPFIEAFEIDNNIRKQIKDEKIEKNQFYIESSFYISANRKFYSSKEPKWFKEITFNSRKLQSSLSYYSVSYNNLNELINLEK
jgi:hypothetical protein